MTNLGVITIGQAPRDDIGPAFARHIGTAPITVIERGALDGLTREQVETDFAPGPDDVTYVTKLLDGSGVTIAKRKILPIMQQHVDDLAQNCTAIVIVCTGDFPMLHSSVPLFFPDRILVETVRERGLDGTVGIMIPLDSQRDNLLAKWSALENVEIAVAAASPYEASDFVGAATELRDRGAGLIVLDCMGYTLEQRAIVQNSSGIETLVPQDFIPEYTVKFVKEENAIE